MASNPTKRRGCCEFEPSDHVRGSWDAATVLAVEVGDNGRTWVLIEWDAVDAAGVDRGPGRTCWRLAWTLRRIDDGL